jgi:uncharacterized protein (DUF58 family)
MLSLLNRLAPLPSSFFLLLLFSFFLLLSFFLSSQQRRERCEERSEREWENREMQADLQAETKNPGPRPEKTRNPVETENPRKRSDPPWVVLAVAGGARGHNFWRDFRWKLDVISGRSSYG